jgi:hypothetical protein
MRRAAAPWDIKSRSHELCERKLINADCVGITVKAQVPRRANTGEILIWEAGTPRDNEGSQGCRSRSKPRFRPGSWSAEPDWTHQFAQGHAGRIMVGESRDAKLLVLGARGHRGLERLLVGSVGHYCLSHAFCPVVWVPAPELDQDEDITDQPIGENASPAGERREDAEQASRRLREELCDNGP